MKVYLLRKAGCYMARTSGTGTGTHERTGDLTFCVKDVSYHINQEYYEEVDEDENDEINEINEMDMFKAERDCESFKSSLKMEGFSFRNKSLNDDNQRQQLSVNLKMDSSKKNSMQIKIQGECLTEICRIFGSDIELQLKLQFKHKRLWTSIMPVISESSDQCKRPKISAYCEDQVEIYEYNAKGQIWFDWVSGPNENLFVRISMAIYGSFPKTIRDPDASSKASIYEKMFKEQTETDVEIFGKDGRSFMCHRELLMEKSPFFAAMFRSNMKESNTNIVKLEIPGESLEPFLDYLYSFEIYGPSSNPQIAIDLLEAAHMYLVERMEKKMEILLQKFPDYYLTPNLAVQLFLVVRNVEKFRVLKRRCVQILKRWGQREVSESEEFNKLFESPSGSVAAKDLTLSLI